jgi:hypothetical protein
LKILKKALAVLGTIVAIAVIIALVAPKSAHALSAMLVSVANTLSNPVPIIEIKDAVSQRIELYCDVSVGGNEPNSAQCDDATKVAAGIQSPYIVPKETTLIITGIKIWTAKLDGSVAEVNVTSSTLNPLFIQNETFADGVTHNIATNIVASTGGQLLSPSDRNLQLQKIDGNGDYALVILDGYLQSN